MENPILRYMRAIQSCSSFSFVCFFVFLSLGACESKIQGNFGWARTDDRGIQEPERSLLVASEFRFARENLSFFSYETIWWAYQISNGFYDKSEFLAALYENNKTPDPVLFDLRRVQLSHNDCCDIIRQKYEQLQPGRYLLKIAYKSQVFDEVEFLVFPPGGASALQTAKDLDEDRLEFDHVAVDDIELYSK